MTRARYLDGCTCTRRRCHFGHAPELLCEGAAASLARYDVETARKCNGGQGTEPCPAHGMENGFCEVRQ